MAKPLKIGKRKVLKVLFDLLTVYGILRIEGSQYSGEWGIAGMCFLLTDASDQLIRCLLKTNDQNNDTSEIQVWIGKK